MKLLLVFALCGVTSCLAVPACTSEDVRKCIEGPPDPETSHEEELDKVCRQTKCYLKVYDRCGTSPWKPYGIVPVKGYRKLVKFACPKISQFRRDFNNNEKCITKATKNMDNLLNLCGIHYNGNRDDICKIIPDGFKCAVNFVKERCGEVAGDVFAIGALPYIDCYDCLSEK